MDTFLKEFEHLKIPLEDIETTTNNFDKSKVIGHGRSGDVYKGELALSMGRRSMVALRRFYPQEDTDFRNAIKILSFYKHQNIISLLGFCNKGDEMILVYDYASNGSLDRHLSNTSLTWSQRIKICLDAARGLCYLHDPNGTQQRVLHRDIKSANILLDDKRNAKVSLMGLSTIEPTDHRLSYIFSNILRTHGYRNPQYMRTYILTKESDIYSFGVVLFEVLCGRLRYVKNNGCLKDLLPKWKHSYQDKKLADIIFHGLTQPMDPTSLKAFSDIAFQCLDESREKRPSMSLIIEKLEIALKFQEPRDFIMSEDLKRICKIAVDPLVFESTQELNVLLFKGLYLNEGKTWFSLNNKKQHCVLMSIDQCLDSYHKDEYYTSRYSVDYYSRFQMGTYNTGDHGYFRTCVWARFLSPGITYMMNLVFKCPDLFKNKHIEKQEYIVIRYNLDLEKRIAIVEIGDKREDEWLVAGLYEFTSIKTIEVFQIEFECHEYWNGGLEIEGIEFQPLKM